MHPLLPITDLRPRAPLDAAQQRTPPTAAVADVRNDAEHPRFADHVDPPPHDTTVRDQGSHAGKRARDRAGKPEAGDRTPADAASDVVQSPSPPIDTFSALKIDTEAFVEVLAASTTADAPEESVPAKGDAAATDLTSILPMPPPAPGAASALLPASGERPSAADTNAPVAAPAVIQPVMPPAVRAAELETTPLVLEGPPPPQSGLLPQPTTAAPVTPPTAHPAVSRPIPAEAVPMTIAVAASDGARRFDIRLDPAELGRIDVSLAVDSDGGIRTHLVVERPETLHLLRNDMTRLEQALTDSGFRNDPAGINLSLRQDQNQRQPADSAPTGNAEAAPGAPAPPAPARAYRIMSAASRIDLVI